MKMALGSRLRAIFLYKNHERVGSLGYNVASCRRRRREIWPQGAKITHERRHIR
jgi:hypothetical protein